jgi:uncharacterized protein
LLVKILLIISIGYIVYGLLLFMLQRKILYPGTTLRPEQFEANESEHIAFEVETTVAKSTVWFIPASQPGDATAATVIFAHGNYEIIQTAFESVERYPDLGVNLLLVEYPGYGNSTGAPSEESITESFIAAFDWFIESEWNKGGKIYGHGRSVGGGAICSLSRKRHLDGMILQSTFTSIKSFSSKYLMPSFLVLDAYENSEAVSTYEGDILIIHGEHDELVPYSHATSLKDAAKNAELMTLQCGHNDCPPDEDVYWESISAFLGRSNGKMQP